jgi:hypothetical protein
LQKKRAPADKNKPGEDAIKAAERALNRLATKIRRFRVDGQRFLAGDLPLPPEELFDEIQKEIRKLRSRNLKSTAVKFRLSSLEAELNSHQGLLGRRIRKREQGEAHRLAEERRLDPVRGVVIGTGGDQQATEALYEGLNRPQMGIDKFRNYIDRQAQAIRSKTGCNDIQFRIAVQDGKLKLKAKPIRD